MVRNEHDKGTITPTQSTVYLDDIDYRESQNLTLLGGFLMTFKNQRRITMNAHLTDENKSRGRDHLLQYLSKVTDEQAVMYLWVCDEEDSNP